MINSGELCFTVKTKYILVIKITFIVFLKNNRKRLLVLNNEPFRSRFVAYPDYPPKQD